MAFADPQSITINAVAQSLPRTGSGVASGVFTKDDGNVKLTVSHQYGKRARRTIRVDHKKIVADQLLAGTSVQASLSVYMVVDQPLNSAYTPAEAKQIVDALTGYLTASSGARVTQLLGGES